MTSPKWPITEGGLEQRVGTDGAKGRHQVPITSQRRRSTRTLDGLTEERGVVDARFGREACILNSQLADAAPRLSGAPRATVTDSNRDDWRARRRAPRETSSRRDRGFVQVGQRPVDYRAGAGRSVCVSLDRSLGKRPTDHAHRDSQRDFSAAAAPGAGLDRLRASASWDFRGPCLQGRSHA